MILLVLTPDTQVVVSWQVHAADLTNLLAPPASGDTTTHSFQSGMFSRIHFSTAGSA